MSTEQFLPFAWSRIVSFYPILGLIIFGIVLLWCIRHIYSLKKQLHHFGQKTSYET